MRGKKERGGPSPAHGGPTGARGEGVGEGLGAPEDTHVCSLWRAGLEVGERPAWGRSLCMYFLFALKQKRNNNNDKQ